MCSVRANAATAAAPATRAHRPKQGCCHGKTGGAPQERGGLGRGRIRSWCRWRRRAFRREGAGPPSNLGACEQGGTVGRQLDGAANYQRVAGESASRTGSASGASSAAPFAPWQLRCSKHGGSGHLRGVQRPARESIICSKSASSKSSKRARAASLGAPASSSAIDRAVPGGVGGAGDRGMCAAPPAPLCGSELNCLNNRRSNVSRTRHSARLAPSSGARRAASIRARPCSS